MIEDSCHVVDREIISPYQSEIAYNAYHVERFTWIPNDYGAYEYWFVPEIGIARMTRNKLMWTPEYNDVWELISFHKADSLTIEEFPIDLGYTWVYEVFNERCSRCTPDTVVATIRSISQPPSSYTTYFMDFYGKDFQASGAIDVDSNTIRVGWTHFMVQFPMFFPMKVGDQWPNYITSDTIRVVDRRLVTTPMGTFNDIYYLEGSLSGFDDGARFYIWIERNLGIVRIDFNTFSMIPELNQTQSWQLIEFTREQPILFFGISHYPNRVGNYWNYEIIDNVKNTIDTMRVEIVDWVLNQDMTSYYIWEYEYPDNVDSQFIFINGDTLLMKPSPTVPYLHTSLVFPLNIGVGWSTFQFYDTSTVVSKEYLSVPAGNYYDAYHVETWLWCGDECGHSEHDWYVPEIGLIKKYIYESEYDMVQQVEIINKDETWRLLNYYIVPIGID